MECGREDAHGRGDLSARRQREPCGAASLRRPNQLFTWRRLAAQGALTAAAAGEEVVPASDHRALQQQIRELQRLLGKKTLEVEILKEVLEQAGPKKRLLLRSPWPARDGSP